MSDEPDDQVTAEQEAAQPRVVTRGEMFGFTADDLDLYNTMLNGLITSGQLWKAAVTDDHVSCDIYDVAAGTEEHNSVGCSLADAAMDVSNYLDASIYIGEQSLADVDFARVAVLQYHLYLALLNGLWERMRDVFTTIEVPRAVWETNAQKYSAFKKARAWANFMKHPGFFAYGLHHPIFVVEGTAAGKEAQAAARKAAKVCDWQLIDSDFVRKHWSSPDGSKAKAALKGQVTACVLLPDPEELTAALCEEYVGFIAQICNNPDYVEILQTFSTRGQVPCFWDSPPTVANPTAAEASDS